MVHRQPCANCGAPVRRYIPNNKKPALELYCSMACLKTFAKKIRPRKNCVVCGEEFDYTASMEKRYATCGDECRKKHKEGSNNGRWLGGGRNRRSWLTHSGKNKRWREAVLERDKVCVDCGSDESLEVDHIQPWIAFPELRYEISNGRVLCKRCHKNRAGETLAKIKEAERIGIYTPRKEEKTYDPISCPNCFNIFIPSSTQKVFCNVKCQRNKYARDSRRKSIRPIRPYNKKVVHQ